jgi:hypothetical protein
MVHTDRLRYRPGYQFFKVAYANGGEHFCSFPFVGANMTGGKFPALAGE